MIVTHILASQSIIIMVNVKANIHSIQLQDSSPDTHLRHLFEKSCSRLAAFNRPQQASA